VSIRLEIKRQETALATYKSGFDLRIFVFQMLYTFTQSKIYSTTISDAA